MWIKNVETSARLCPLVLGSVANQCRGQQCMAWRWHPLHLMDGMHADEGHCGMAGTPLRKVVEGEREDRDHCLRVDRPS